VGSVTETTSSASFEDLSEVENCDESVTIDLTVNSNDSVLTTKSSNELTNICAKPDDSTGPRKKQKICSSAAAFRTDGRTLQDAIILDTGNFDEDQNKNYASKVMEDTSTSNPQSKRFDSNVRSKTIYRITVVGGANLGFVVTTNSHTTFRDLRCEIIRFTDLPFVNFCFDLGDDLVVHSHQETLETDELLVGEGTRARPYLVYIKELNKPVI
jgi:hypothetical protein